MDMSPLPLYWVAVKGVPDETSLKSGLVDSKETIMGPESPHELKYSPPMEFSTQPFCSASFKSEPEEVDTDLSFNTSPKTEVIDSKEMIIQELVPELPKEYKYSPPVDLSADPFSSDDVKIEPEEIDTDLSYDTLPRSEEEDLMTETPGDIINGNSSDGTSPNCASYSMPSSSGGVGELPTNKCQLRTHLHSFDNIKSEDAVFSCSVCDKIYFKRTEFMKHFLEFHPRMNVHICPVCREVFHAYWDLHEYLSDYSVNDSYLCARCGEMFPARSTLEQHMKMGGEYALCVIEFYKDSPRNQDIKTNTKEIEFYKDSPCNQDIKTNTKEIEFYKDSPCNQDIKTNTKAIEFCKDSPRNQNIETNTTEILTCDVCGKSFLQWIAFAKHIASHSKDDQLDCPRCEQKFGTQSSLLNHLRAHRSHPHMCSKCQKCFTKLYDLKRHGQICKGACTSITRRLPIYFHRTYARIKTPKPTEK
ncbi:zinc finger protein 599 isoform X6 [Anabrus simplex]|uniref:zinc finger protein 599 isoform X6 n=1 Tax=Anabrus simplex TaxID=316456 RepID=UPI0034DD8C91